MELLKVAARKTSKYLSGLTYNSCYINLIANRLFINSHIGGGDE
ncbi:hypothetical protein SAMN03159307_04665 [Pseudomonas sp. NFACC46-3]|nr:hypothetical protein SAMN03159307_04665 [Pseudomonas sp. NFACC46-3]